MTIQEILSLSIDKRKEQYGKSSVHIYRDKPIGVETVIIDGNPFTDYKAFSFLWEKSYVKSPERSSSGAIENLDSYATFVTPHLKIDFSLLSIDSYRDIMTLLYVKNEHIVECYDIIRDEWCVNNMYFSTEEMPKLFTIARALNGERWVELIGIEDYTVELIGTNTNFEKLTLTYNVNVPSGATWANDTTASITFAKNTTVGIGSDAKIKVNNQNQSIQSLTFGDTYIFNGWNTKADGKGINYINGDEYYLMGNTTLYAQWRYSQ